MGGYQEKHSIYGQGCDTKFKFLPPASIEEFLEI